MHKSLLPTYQIIETSLEHLVTDLSKYSKEILQKKPDANAWSVLEIIQHLLIAERRSFAYAKKKTSYPESLKEAGFIGHYRKLQLYLFMRLPIKVKAPPLVNEGNFEQNVTFEGLVSDWRVLRTEMKEFLDNAPEDWNSKLTFRHGFAGRMTFDGMLMFFSDHLTRHRKQIDRTLAKLNKN